MYLIFAISVFGQNEVKTFSYIFNKEDIKQLFSSSGKSIKIYFTIQGLIGKKEAKNLKSQTSFNKFKIKSGKDGYFQASAKFTANIDAFRKEIEKNNVTFILVNGIKIKVSNLISQEKANELAKNIIDVPPIQFKAEHNTPDNLGHFEFNVYYFETKLFYAMQKYEENLLLGHIDKLQQGLKDAKENKEDFIKQHSN
ncbi:MAG: hypothetical protein A2275_04385 [Bacteroidetes bacterium RIFOXYA12_FULL_35_11]|nr:MAG: hypothetical protein A2X01_07835 [Bacteroidetes bacterium GWF2_35_48]OFY75549.1 MAG: hypothetical protein A2275_04385 [Bacteroidetes bacterium RIFOXYA12_FULL_35_11]OFY95861.1 MAG: hypothetical protein A2309_11385 [Bacteroidetes bacterium RIFOXYB2_FULL_35_7]HBX49816.1 hypothetical protein [Bacteroidales bacterium]